MKHIPATLAVIAVFNAAIESVVRSVALSFAQISAVPLSNSKDAACFSTIESQINSAVCCRGLENTMNGKKMRSRTSVRCAASKEPKTLSLRKLICRRRTARLGLAPDDAMALERVSIYSGAMETKAGPRTLAFSYSASRTPTLLSNNRERRALCTDVWRTFLIQYLH